MAITKVITDRQATKLTSLVRRGESPPPPRINQVMRSTNVHRQGNYHPPMTVVATCDSSIGPNGGSGFCTVQQGPHPLRISSEKYRAYNYAKTALEASSHVMLTWIRATGTNGFWLAVPLCCGDVEVAACTNVTSAIPIPLAVRITGVVATDPNKSAFPAALNQIHSLGEGGSSECVRTFSGSTASVVYEVEALAGPSGWEVDVFCSNDFTSYAMSFASVGRAAPFNPNTLDNLSLTFTTGFGITTSGITVTVNP